MDLAPRDTEATISVTYDVSGAAPASRTYVSGASATVLPHTVTVTYENLGGSTRWGAHVQGKAMSGTQTLVSFDQDNADEAPDWIIAVIKSFDAALGSPVTQ